MPYKLSGKRVLVQRGGVWKLLKEHPSREAALKHFQALQINVMGKEKHARKK